MLNVMALSTNRAVLSLYKTMLRESQKFTDLNYRSWALRRVRDGFRANSKLAEQSSVERQIQYAKQNLIIMKRQTTVGQLFNFLTWELNWVLIYILKFDGNNNLVKEVDYKEAYLNTSSFVAMLVIEINMRRRKYWWIHEKMRNVINLISIQSQIETGATHEHLWKVSAIN